MPATILHRAIGEELQVHGKLQPAICDEPPVSDKPELLEVRVTRGDRLKGGIRQHLAPLYAELLEARQLAATD